MHSNEILFRTKLNIPFGHKNAVFRTRIMDELDKALKIKLTLVTAPAGFGKTTAVACWVRQSGLPAAWFSIDSHDNNVKKFWSYVIAALEMAIPGTVGLFSRGVYTADHFAAEALVAALVDVISKSETELVLVLDDYHLIVDEAIHDSLFMLIKYMPANAHVIISGRSKPSFISARYEISGEMKEIGMQELRFVSSEIESFSRTYDIVLSKNELTMLEESIDGWAAGLRLIFDTLVRENAFDFSKLAAGSEWDNQKIAAYLMEEVIGHCTDEERSFMLKTSILSQLCGSLCDVLTGCADGQDVLEKLSRRNAFIVPMDNEGKWYRYHHLFAEFLQAWLATSNLFSACELHEKAGNWYERNRFIEEAVDHYLQCDLTDKIVAIIERNGRQLLKTGDFSILIEWLSSLPPARVKSNDALCLTYAWALMLSGSVNEAETWLNVLEERHSEQDNLPRDDTREKQIEFEILYFKSFAGLWRDDRNGILYALKQMKELEDENVTIDFSLNINSGEASLMAGMLGFKGRISLLDEYASIYESVRKDVIKRNIGFIPALLGEVLFERNHLDDALILLVKALDEAESAQMPGSFIPAIVTLARIMKARGDIAGAYEIITDAEMKLFKMGRVQFQPILSAFKVRIAIECEDHETVDQWLQINCINLHDAPSLHRIYKLITLARVLIFKRNYDGAVLLLDRLLIFVQKEDNLYYLIEIINLLAIAYNAAGQTQKAMVLLRESLLLGEREGYERHYIEEGMAMAALLGRFLRKYYSRRSDEVLSISPLYLRRLLAQTRAYCLTIKAFMIKKDSDKVTRPGLIQPLTKREKEILRFISSELTNLEIAHMLDISLNTVKVNCTNIYRKLQVNNREQAARRARELNILD